jgi:hypothetical protein
MIGQNNPSFVKAVCSEIFNPPKGYVSFQDVKKSGEASGRLRALEKGGLRLNAWLTVRRGLLQLWSLTCME